MRVETLGNLWGKLTRKIRIANCLARIKDWKWGIQQAKGKRLKVEGRIPLYPFPNSFPQFLKFLHVIDQATE